MVIAPAEHHDADQNVQGEKDENEANGALLAALQGVVPAEMQGWVFTLLECSRADDPAGAGHCGAPG
jgi:hypothetical protein